MPILRTLALLMFTVSSAQAASLSSGTANVCMNVAPYAEVALTQPLDLEPVNKQQKGASHYRAQSALWLETNADVELNVMASSISDGVETVMPRVKLDNRSGIVNVPYVRGGSTHDIHMDVTWSKDHIQKAGFYQGQVSVIVTANLAETSCL